MTAIFIVPTACLGALFTILVFGSDLRPKEVLGLIGYFYAGFVTLVFLGVTGQMFFGNTRTGKNAGRVIDRFGEKFLGPVLFFVLDAIVLGFFTFVVRSC